MIITIHSDYRDTDNAYCLEKYLRDGLGFTVLERDLTISKLYIADIDFEDLHHIMGMIAEYQINIEIDFKADQINSLIGG